MSSNGKIRIDQSSFTLRELSKIDEMIGGGMSEAGTAPGKSPLLMAAFLAVTKQRTDPDFTYEQALDLHMTDMELVEAPEAEGDDGTTPPLSPESGASTPST